MESLAKSPVFRIACGILLTAFTGAGCKEKPARVAPETTQAEAPPPAAHAELPKLPVTPSAAPAFPKVTPEQSASTVRVRVVSGGLPPTNHVGALLHRDEVAAIAGLQGNTRCVLALLHGWTSVQLHGSACQIHVLRRPGGRPETAATEDHTARLIQFDEQTGLAVLLYTEYFDSSVDAGYHIDRSPGSTQFANALRSRSAEGSENASQRPVLLYETGFFSSKEQNGAVQFPADKPETIVDDSPALVSGKDKLAGFLSVNEDSNAPTVVPLQNFKLVYKTPELKLIGIAFAKSAEGRLRFSVKVESDNPAFAAKFLSLRQKEIPDAASAPVSDQKVYAPIETHFPQTIAYDGSEGWRGAFQLLPADGEEKTYLLQLGWSAEENRQDFTVFGKPFVMTLKSKAGETTASVSGLPNLSDVKPDPQIAAVTSFDLEAPIRDFHEIAGGREVLIQLESAPFWKRFSFTTKQWLPLPVIALPDAYITGNLTSLFVLDRRAAELRKYDLATLKQMAAVKLPTGYDYVAVIAGCNTERGPVNVVMRNGTISLFAENLGQREYLLPGEKQTEGEEFKVEPNENFHITGDGLNFQPYTEKLNSYHARHYTSDALGAHHRFFDGNFTLGQCGGGVSGAYIASADGYTWLSGAIIVDEKPLRIPPPAGPPGFLPRWLVPASPTILRLLPEQPKAIPATPPRIECISYFDSAPFATVDVPEWTHNTRAPILMNYIRWLAFDPNSRQVAVASLDRKKWLVHQFAPAPSRDQPVMLNWPDTILTRGAELRFKPLLLGEGTVTVALEGTQSTPPPKVSNGEISVSFPADELASLSLLKVSVHGKQGGGMTYTIPVHLLGPEQAIAMPSGTAIKEFANVGAGFKSIAEPKNRLTVLRTTIHPFKEPVRQVLGPVAGHIILPTEGGRVDLLSIENRRITRSIQGRAGATYYTGAGALFEYDPAAGTFTRIGIPEGQRERTLTFPRHLRLLACGAGSDPDSPLTVLVQQVQGQQTEQFGDLHLTLTFTEGSTVILDNRTLQATGWAQPKHLSKDANSRDDTFVSPGNAVPTGRNGLFVTLPTLAFALGHNASYVIPFSAPMLQWGNGKTGPTGSISGMSVADSRAQIYRGGVNEPEKHNAARKSVTPCGRYLLCEAGGDNNRHLEVWAAESDRLLFHLARMSLDAEDFDFTKDYVRTPRRVLSLGENGPLTVLSGNGKLLQVIDCDIPHLAQVLDPDGFHVTSQAPPTVQSGKTLDYQIQVNNPAVVSGYRLREATPGASITPQGLLHFVAPAVTNITRLELSTEVIGKDGKSVAHGFPVFVLP